MENLSLVSRMLGERGLYPVRDSDDSGMDISVTDQTVTLTASKNELIELADLLVSLALTEEAGAHWHLDDLNMMREQAGYALIVNRRDQ